MEKNYLQISCGDCKFCCHHNLFVGKSLSQFELESIFFFNERLSDIFFKKIENLYYINKTCTKYSNGKCTLHNTIEYPMICAIYPIMFVYDKKYTFIAIDKICPRWKNIYKEFKQDENLKYKLLEIIKNYNENKRLDIFLLQRMKDCGYKLKKLTKLNNLKFF